MSDQPSKVQRWLDVISFLASRRFPVSVEELWRAVPAYARGLDGSEKEKQTVRRMFERDKDELKKLGVPVDTVEYTINHYEKAEGYRLDRRNFHLPYLRLLEEAGEDEARPKPGAGSPEGAAFELTESEASAALEGLKELADVPGFPLARSARSAFRKLAFDLEPTAPREASVLYARDPEAEAAADVLTMLNDAVRRGKTTTFRYRSMSSDSEEKRTVRPYGLLFQHGRWYLVGHDEDREAERMYRVGRMAALAVNRKAPGTRDFSLPEDFRLDAYAGRKAWEMGADEEGPVEATVRFAFPRSLWAERNEHGVLVSEESDGVQLRRFTVHRRDPFLRWVLSLAGDARVESPDELRRAFQSMAERVFTLHGGEQE